MVRVWDLSSGRCAAVLQGHTGLVESVALSRDGRTAISGSHDHTVRVWDLASGRCSAVLEGHTHKVESVAMSVDGRTAISGSHDHTVRVWDLSTGRCTAVLQGHTSGVRELALSADGRTAISESWDMTVRMWDMAGGECRAIFPCDENPISLALARRPPWIVVVGDAAGNVLFFRIETEKTLRGAGVFGPARRGAAGAQADGPWTPPPALMSEALVSSRARSSPARSWWVTAVSRTLDKLRARFRTAASDESPVARISGNSR